MMLKKIRKLTGLSDEKLRKIIIIVLVVALAGIFLSENLFKNAPKEEKSQNSMTALNEYEKSLEKRISSILSDIEGVGKCSVMVTLESSLQSVYSSDSEEKNETGEQNNSRSQSLKHVILNNSGEQAVLEKQIQPKIRGVVVVCEGADNPVVAENVSQALKAVLGVTGADISVVKGGKYD